VYIPLGKRKGILCDVQVEKGKISKTKTEKVVWHLGTLGEGINEEPRKGDRWKGKNTLREEGQRECQVYLHCMKRKVVKENRRKKVPLGAWNRNKVV